MAMLNNQRVFGILFLMVLQGQLNCLAYLTCVDIFGIGKYNIIYIINIIYIFNPKYNPYLGVPIPNIPRVWRQILSQTFQAHILGIQQLRAPVF